MASNAGDKAFLVGTAVEGKRRVKIKAGTTTTPPEVEHSGAGEDYIGVTDYAGAVGDNVNVRLKNSAGSVEIEAVVTTAIAAGSALFPAANGMVGDNDNAGAYTSLGVALEAGVTGQHLEVLAG